jgi:hypothetical protein
MQRANPFGRIVIPSRILCRCGQRSLAALGMIKMLPGRLLLRPRVQAVDDAHNAVSANQACRY